MVTTIDKALQDFIVSAIGIAALFGFDLSKWENVIVTVGVAGGKALLTWLIPNKKPS